LVSAVRTDFYAITSTAFLAFLKFVFEALKILEPIAA